MDVSPKSKFRRLIRFSTGTRCSFSSGTIKHVLLTETQGEEWAAAHPKCMDSGAKENNTYFKLSRTVTDGELNGNIAKVIRRVAKNVVINK